MKPRYVLAPETALDLVDIWRYIGKESSVAMADRVEKAILDRLSFWQARPAPDIGVPT